MSGSSKKSSSSDKGSSSAASGKGSDKSDSSDASSPRKRTHGGSSPVRRRSVFRFFFPIPRVFLFPLVLALTDYHFRSGLRVYCFILACSDESQRGGQGDGDIGIY